jgi:hypothetical protein
MRSESRIIGLLTLAPGSDSPTPCESPLRSFIQELERSYSFFNWRFMGNALPSKVVISVGETEQGFAGWFRHAFERKRKETSLPHFGVSINTTTSVLELCHVLLHEMAHLRNYILGIKDVGRAQYHNRHFRDSHTTTKS